MTSKVGPKGQVVIEKAIRDRLGVVPGWLAVQLLEGNHVALYLVPPPHQRSLRGAATPFITRRPGPEDWDELVAEAAADAFIREADPGNRHADPA